MTKKTTVTKFGPPFPALRIGELVGLPQSLIYEFYTYNAFKRLLAGENAHQAGDHLEVRDGDVGLVVKLQAGQYNKDILVLFGETIVVADPYLLRRVK